MQSGIERAVLDLQDVFGAVFDGVGDGVPVRRDPIPAFAESIGRACPGAARLPAEVNPFLACEPLYSHRSSTTREKREWRPFVRQDKMSSPEGVGKLLKISYGPIRLGGRSFGVRQLAAAFRPASLLAGFWGRAALARVERDERRVGASKLAGGKAAASCRTLKLRKQPARGKEKPRTYRTGPRLGASKLAGGKAAASCRTLKLRKHAARERKAADRHNKSRYGLA